MAPGKIANHYIKYLLPSIPICFLTQNHFGDSAGHLKGDITTLRHQSHFGFVRPSLMLCGIEQSQHFHNIFVFVIEEPVGIEQRQVLCIFHPHGDELRLHKLLDINRHTDTYGKNILD